MTLFKNYFMYSAKHKEIIAQPFISIPCVVCGDVFPARDLIFNYYLHHKDKVIVELYGKDQRDSFIYAHCNQCFQKITHPVLLCRDDNNNIVGVTIDESDLYQVVELGDILNENNQFKTE